jgi:hypothetical protein
MHTFRRQPLALLAAAAGVRLHGLSEGRLAVHE